MLQMVSDETRAPATTHHEPSNGKRERTTEVQTPSEKVSTQQQDGESKTKKPQSASHVDVDLGPRLCVSCLEKINDLNKAAEITSPSECIVCELISNLFPSNKLQGDRDEPWPSILLDQLRYDSAKYYSKASIMNWETGRPCAKLVQKMLNHTIIFSNESQKIVTGDTDFPATIGEVINFGMVASWLEHCETVHGTRCVRRDSPLRLPKPIDVIVVDVFRNCLTTKTTTTRYFALSYVWGNAITRTTTTTTHNLPGRMESGSLDKIPSLPKTVFDAIELTRKMGVRYLWVDCLSIVQDSPKKHQDIHNMDIIFAQATLTIVAVGGVDADSGLPGVRPGTRKERITTITHGRYTAKLSLPVSKFEVLHRTAYKSRGWTFQELLLSKRLLFLTEYQALFHCDLSLRSEAVPKEDFKNTGQYGHGNITLQSNGGLPRDSDTILNSYCAMIKEYTVRQLSYEEDIENAFSGLASILDEWCGGSPVVHGMMSSFFGYSMQWTFQQDQGFYNTYTAKETGKKRAAFPSWSWVAWTASVSNICNHSAAYLPLQSLMKNVIITSYGTRKGPVSHTVFDQSAVEDDALSEGQLIRIDLKPAELGLSPSINSTLEFEAERTHWINYKVKYVDLAGHILVFTSTRESSPCGFLSLVPARDINDEVRNQAARTVPQYSHTLNLIRTHCLELTPWDGSMDDIQLLLNAVEDFSDTERGFAKKFRKRLQQFSLLSILLVRPQGQSWERIGSGLIFEKDWPSTSKQTKIQAYQEHMVLI